MCSVTLNCLRKVAKCWRYQWSVRVTSAICCWCTRTVLTDWMEAGISTNENLATKQWKIEADGTVEIYSLKVLGNRSVLFDEDFNTVRMQREDDVYQIDGKGKFKRVEKAKFPAREYSKAELQDKERNIWDE